MAWRKRFPYIRVASGLVLKCSTPVGVIEECISPPESMDIGGREGASAHFYSDSVDLCVTGRSMPIHPPTVPVDECEEIIAQDGILEEVYEVDKQSGEAGEESNDNFAMSPSASMRQEVVSSIFSAIWPDVVRELTPLIERIIRPDIFLYLGLCVHLYNFICMLCAFHQIYICVGGRNGR